MDTNTNRKKNDPEITRQIDAFIAECGGDVRDAVRVLLARRDTIAQLNQIQHNDGNWNYNNYMLGMANGLELAESNLFNREPVFLDHPAEWLADKPPSSAPLGVQEPSATEEKES